MKTRRWDATLCELAESQSGYFTAAQARQRAVIPFARPAPDLSRPAMLGGGHGFTTRSVFSCQTRTLEFCLDLLQGLSSADLNISQDTASSWGQTDQEAQSISDFLPHAPGHAPRLGENSANAEKLSNTQPSSASPRH
jgi:hypothetical protein